MFFTSCHVSVEHTEGPLRWNIIIVNPVRPIVITLEQIAEHAKLLLERNGVGGRSCEGRHPALRSRLNTIGLASHYVKRPIPARGNIHNNIYHGKLAGRRYVTLPHMRLSVSL